MGSSLAGWRQITSRGRILLRGESAVALSGIALVAILVIAMSAVAWWVMRTQRESLARARAEHVKTVGGLLAHNAESLLGAGEVSAVRSAVANAAHDYDLGQCRLVLPDGSVLADVEPSRITLKTLPEHWNGAAPVASTVQDADGGIVSVTPVTVPGRGNAAIEITAATNLPFWSYSEAQSGIGVIGASALVALLLVYRHMRRRMRGMSAIRDALLAIGRGETLSATLAVGPDSGPEGEAWNRILAEREGVQKSATHNRVKELLGSRRGAGTDLDAAFDALWQGLILIDGQMKVKYANGAAAVFMQRKREEIVGAEVLSLLEEPALVDAVKQAVAGTLRRRASIEVERKGEDGKPTGMLRFIVRPVRRDDPPAAMIVIDDITQLRVAEEARNSFVAQATHELRTPLTNICLYVESALENDGKDPALMGKCLNVINQEAHRLERIVGDMLSVSEIEAGSRKLRADDVRLDAMFEELKADFVAQAGEKGLALTFNLPPKLPVVHGDRDKILLALHNLLGNALKYTLEGSVTVAVKADDKQLVIDVIDTGIGIGEEDQERLFEKFYRAKDQRVSDIVGTGLGLALAREVVRLHGGDVTVQSELDKGSTFTVVLPTRAEAA